MDDDLPAYFDEPEVVADAREEAAGALLAPPRPRPTGDLIPLGVSIQPATPTTVVVQVVPIRPDVAGERLGAWASALAARGGPWCTGRDHLVVVDPAASPCAGRSCCGWHVRIDVHRRGHATLPIEVGCAAWSSTRAELHVVPVRAARDRRRYFHAAHTVLDRLVRDLR